MSTFSAFGIIPYINMIKKCFLYFPLCAMMCLVLSNSAILWTVAHQAPLSMGFFR